MSLSPWLVAAAEAASAQPDPSLLTDDAVTVLLDLARDAAHEIARPAAPVAAFALGLAAGQGNADLVGLRSLAASIATAARSFDGKVE
jgi:hypothetical protein